MKKMALLLCLSTIFLTGCGTSLITLTDSESELIISYASYVLLKYNAKAVHGLTDADLEDTADETTEETTQEETQTADASGDVSTENSTGTSTEESTASLDEVLDLSGCSISYVSSEIADDYMEEELFLATPSSGCCYLVLTFSITNQTGNTVSVDTLSQLPSFQVLVGDSSYTASRTVLSNDLANIDEDIAAGDSTDAVLLVEVPEGTTDSASKVTVTVGENSGSMDIP